jgi:hypothetical protein
VVGIDGTDSTSLEEEIDEVLEPIIIKKNRQYIYADILMTSHK